MEIVTNLLTYEFLLQQLGYLWEDPEPFPVRSLSHNHGDSSFEEYLESTTLWIQTDLSCDETEIIISDEDAELQLAAWENALASF